MPWTTPGTAVAGDVLTAAFWNTQVRDNMANLNAAGANNVGMVYITKASISAATTINVNSCFSATYTHYRIILQGGLTSVATGGNTIMRMRVGGVDNSGATAYNYQGAKLGAAAITTESGSTSSFVVTYGGFNTANSRWGNAIIDVFNPFSTDWTHYHSKGNGVDGGGAEACFDGAGSHRVAASYDGFSIIYPQAVTTTAYVFGVRDTSGA